MKNIIIQFFLLLTFVSHSFDQERINREKLHFLEQSGSIKEATGWCYNKAIGEWIDYPNFISSNKRFKKHKTNTVYSRDTISDSFQNFIDLHFKTVMLEDEKFYTLFIEYSGKIKDFMYGYTFAEDDIEKIRHLKESEIVELATYVYFSVDPDFDSDEVLASIRNRLEIEKTEDNAYYVFYIKKVENGLVRFLLPIYYIGSIVGTYVLEDKYFETTEDNFNNLIRFKPL